MEAGKMSTEEMLKDSKKILKNEFRKEVQDPYAGIPEVVLVRRDQDVLLREIRLRKMIREVNNVGLQKILDSAKALRMELTALPKSPYREVCIDNLGKTIENNQQVLNANKLPMEVALTLLALEELFVETKDVSDRNQDGSPYQAVRVSSEDSEAEDELTIPDEPEGDDPNEII